MTTKIKGLKRFNVVGNLPKDPGEQGEIFRSESIRKITCFVLGPLGTNMVQACEQWIKEMNIEDKTEIILCETPEESIERARNVNEEGHVAIFWTCAVYNCLCNVFFQNPDTLTFFIEVVMYLDEMQLAARPEKVSEVEDGIIPKHWKILSHPSPAPLVRDLGCEIILTTSNAKAAELCAAGKSDACITTEAARKIYNLATLHKFGSPKMVFFGGITTHGVEIISKICDEDSKNSEEYRKRCEDYREKHKSDEYRVMSRDEIEIREKLGYVYRDMYFGIGLSSRECLEREERMDRDNMELNFFYEDKSKQINSLDNDLKEKVEMWLKLPKPSTPFYFLISPPR